MRDSDLLEVCSCYETQHNILHFPLTVLGLW